jgi:CheY-like chemotaxis protein
MGAVASAPVIRDGYSRNDAECVFGDALTMTKRDVNEPAGSLPASVLLVEDNVIIALDTEETLKRLGVDVVITASSVSQALAAIEKHSPAFALLDVALGAETGFAVAERLAGLKIPFVFATGYGEQFAFPAMFANAPKIGKPYSVDTLRAMLELAEF